jgi:hypothetical protein
VIAFGGDLTAVLIVVTGLFACFLAWRRRRLFVFPRGIGHEGASVAYVVSVWQWRNVLAFMVLGGSFTIFVIPVKGALVVTFPLAVAQFPKSIDGVTENAISTTDGSGL